MISLLNECSNLKHLFNIMNPEDTDVFYYVYEDCIEVCTGEEYWNYQYADSEVIHARKGLPMKKLRRWAFYSRFDMLDELRRANWELIDFVYYYAVINDKIDKWANRLSILHEIANIILNKEIYRYEYELAGDKNEIKLTFYTNEEVADGLYYFYISRNMFRKFLALYKGMGGLEDMLWYLEKIDSHFRAALWEEIKNM